MRKRYVAESKIKSKIPFIMLYDEPIFYLCENFKKVFGPHFYLADRSKLNANYKIYDAIIVKCFSRIRDNCFSQMKIANLDAGIKDGPL